MSLTQDKTIRLCNKDNMMSDDVQDVISNNVDISIPELEKLASKRIKCEALANSFSRLKYHNKAARVRDCGTQLVFAYIIAEQRLKLHRANFCKERLCPMCAMKKTKQIFAQVSQVMDAVEQERPSLTPIFLTLTVKNCEATELKDTLDTIFQGWNRMMANKRMKRIIVGWFRALEITYNVKADTYHPHVHAILLVSSSYFTTPKDYMTNEKWVAAWRKAMRLDYDPSCDIRAVKAGGNNRSSAVAEVAKYTVKDTDYLKGDDVLTDKLVNVFGSAVKGRRLYAFGGLMKEIAKRLKLDFDKFTADEITDKDGFVIRKDIDYILLSYHWSIGLSRYEYKGAF